MKVGIMFDAQEDMSWERWMTLSRLLEDLGFESLWRSDHLFSLVGFPDRDCVETWTSLTQLAAATKRLRFGPLVSPVTFRHPALLALQAASVDQLSNGRLEIGVGVGWNTLEHNAFGLALPPKRVRCEMLDESISVMKLIWSGEDVSFEGKHYTLKDARGHPRTTQQPRPPILVGGIGDSTIAIAAKHADEWNSYGLFGNAYRGKLEVLAQKCEEAGRDICEIRYSVAGPLAIGTSEDEVRKRLGRLRQVFPHPPLYPETEENDPATFRGRGWFAGRPEEIAEQIADVREAGAHRVIFHHLDVTDHESLELAATLLNEAA